MEEIQDNRNRILIVDDDLEVLDVLRAYLEPMYIVGTVAYGEFAVDYIKQYPTDLILMDILMPTMDGFETYKELRSIPEGKDIPVVLVTGKSNRNTVLESINLGVDGYLLKPLNKEMVVGKIQEILLQKEEMPLRKTILAIDDDVTYLRIISKSLKGDFNVIMLNSGQLAIEYMKNHVPDIVLLDYLMPKDGSSVVMEFMMSVPELQKVPVIMITGINNKDLVIEKLPKRPDRFLIKPVSKLDLLRAIVSSLNEKGLKVRP